LNQRTIIVTSFGWTPLQTTLFGCIDGVIEIITIFVGVQLAARIPNSRAYLITLCSVPNILGCLLVTLLPWTNKVGLLCAIWTLDVGLTGFVLVLSWITSVTAGHTKRITTNTVLLISYCLGNALAPLMWEAKYQPRNYVPWGIIGGCYLVCAIVPLVIRWVLSRENTLRDKEEHDPTYDNVYIEHITPEGKMASVKVPKEFLDLTDRQNRDFRYVL